jgi:hypothetical protein
MQSLAHTATAPTMKTINPLLTRIAQKTLGIDTLQPQGTDRLDFHEVSVQGLHDALEAAYNAGAEQGRKAGKTP